MTNVPFAVSYCPPGDPSIVIEGTFGMPPCQIQINHLPLSLDEARSLRDALSLAIHKAEKR